jgi:hypothetical protein
LVARRIGKYRFEAANLTVTAMTVAGVLGFNYVVFQPPTCKHPDTPGRGAMLAKGFGSPRTTDGPRKQGGPVVHGIKIGNCTTHRGKCAGLYWVRDT